MPRTIPVLDGVEQLTTLLVDGVGYGSVVEAVAEHTVFLHPRTVEQTDGQAPFPIIRYSGDKRERGKPTRDAYEREAIFDDNTTPREVFLRAGRRSKGPDVQFNHVWDGTGRDRDAYTALWNVCATPAFLAKTTDGRRHPEVREALWYRSYELYGMTPTGVGPPSRPKGYRRLKWAAPPPPVDDLEAVLRAWLHSCTSCRAATAARNIGWLFSGWEPDAELPAPKPRRRPL